MFSLLLAAAGLTPAIGDISYTDLGYAKPGTDGYGCIARFDNGTIEITQAFNESARTISNVAMVTGKTERTLPVGSKLWVRSSFGPAWRAVVVESKPGRIRFVAHHRFAADLFAEGSLTIMLQHRLEDGPRDAVFVNVATDVNDARGKLAEAFDCSDGLGI